MTQKIARFSRFIVCVVSWFDKYGTVLHTWLSLQCYADCRPLFSLLCYENVLHHTFTCLHKRVYTCLGISCPHCVHHLLYWRQILCHLDYTLGTWHLLSEGGMGRKQGCTKIIWGMYRKTVPFWKVAPKRCPKRYSFTDDQMVA